MKKCKNCKKNQLLGSTRTISEVFPESAERRQEPGFAFWAVAIPHI